MENKSLTRGELKRLVYSRVLMVIPVLLLLFFLPAGTLAYWEAWMYLAILLIPMVLVFIYLLKNDPELLERRMRLREKEKTQKLLILFSIIYFLVAFSLPGFDQRFGWSNAPVLAVIMGDIVVLLGYGLFVWVLMENRYASRTIVVEQNQQVISSGPYAIVRHPMYLASTLMYLASPLGLGSYWAMIPAFLIIPILVLRIVNEEKLLSEGLPGYKEYKQKTRYRLIPGIW